MQDFTVSPMKQTIELKAGETYHGYIIVSVPAEAKNDFAFRVEVSPYSVSGSEYTADFTTESDWTQITNWVSLETKKGTLKPNESKRINFEIKVPENAPAGGQYMMLGVSADTTAGGNESAVSSVIEMASLVYANVDGEIKHGGRVQENYLPGFVATGVPTSKVVLVNDGNVHEIATTEIKLKNVFSGEEIKYGSADENIYETMVMPETTREVTRELEGLPLLGIYDVTQTVSYMSDESSTHVTMILCPAWFILLVILTIASIIGMICYGVHLHHKKARIE